MKRLTDILSCGFCGFVLLYSSVLLAQDVKGSGDNPLLSRYEGSNIVGYRFKEFDEYTAAIGPAKGNYWDVKWDATQDLEGAVTRILYRVPQGRTSLEVFRNYQMELEKNGFEVLYSCKKEECGKAFYMKYQTLWAGTGYRDTYATELPNQRYMAVKLTRAEGDLYAFLHIAEHTFMNTLAATYVQLDIVQMKAMDTGMVVIDADALAKDINETGHIAIYGIYFDTDKAVVKAESKPSIEQIAKLMKDTPELKLFIVGHTDNKGAVQYNMDLSHRRATAVRDELVKTYGIDINRLGAVGMGFFGPVTSNKTEDGRALNRRVELVEWNQ